MKKINPKIVFNSLVFKITMILIIIFMLPTAIMTNWLLRESKQISFDESAKFLTSNLTLISENFDELLHNTDFLHSQVLNDNEFLEMNKQLLPIDQRETYLDYQLENKILTRLVHHYTSLTSAASISLYNASSQTLFDYSLNHTNNRVINAPTAEMLKEIHQVYDGLNKRKWHLRFDQNLNEYVLSSVSRPTMFSEISPTLYLSIQISFKKFINSIGSTFSDDISIYAADSNGTVITIKNSYDENTDVLIKDRIQKLDKNQDLKSQIAKLNKVEWLVSNHTTTYADITYYAVAPLSSINKTPVMVSGFRNMMFFFIFIVFFVTLFVLIIYIIPPIHNLYKKIRLVEAGDLDVRVQTNRTDEFGYISKRFNEMLDSICNLIEENYKSNIAKKEYELKYVQTQINEHFLYNTLDSIHWIAKKHHVDEISNIVFNLSEFFRNSLSSGSDTITIRQVEQIFRSYIHLLNVRIEQDITLNFTTQGELPEIKLLKYVFQPLLENAIVHGILKDHISGIIDVHFYTEEDVIFFEIKDNGVGIERSVLETIQSSIKNFNHNTSTNHFALRNISQQLFLYYANNAKLEIQSELNKRTTATIRFRITE